MEALVIMQASMKVLIVQLIWNLLVIEVQVPVKISPIFHYYSRFWIWMFFQLKQNSNPHKRF